MQIGPKDSRERILGNTQRRDGSHALQGIYHALQGSRNPTPLVVGFGIYQRIKYHSASSVTQASREPAVIDLRWSSSKVLLKSI